MRLLVRFLGHGFVVVLHRAFGVQAEMELGRIRPLDAGVSAVVLAGALAAFTHRECMPRPLQEQTVRIDRGRFVRGLMDVLWPGMKP